MSKVGKDERKLYKAVFTDAAGFDGYGDPVPAGTGNFFEVECYERNGNEAERAAYHYESKWNRGEARIFFTGIVYRVA